eukprot:TRINITY_DN602_c4_g1_i2.p1 TRINITY_DN602_c4_g1~~TRINITY_DN602_c4_g1_i2.p1  ORF type:complete len:286 (+),score=10.82 TRINITY_DN602_c4_g1_i2:58-915(+)
MNHNVFITEVGIPAPGLPGPIVSESMRDTRIPRREMVKNIYDFPSVQNLKVENGDNLPWRYKIRPPGRAPVFRMAQGKRHTHQAQRMARHQAIFPPGVDENQGGMIRMLSEAKRKEISCRLPNVRAAPERCEELCEIPECSRSPSVVSVPSSHSVKKKILRERLSKESMAVIESRSGIEVPLQPPTPSAPPPIPCTPIASSVVSNSSAYDNLTSVSLRTPQTSAHSTNLQSGINRLQKNLLEEQSYKKEVQDELKSLKVRQEALIAVLSPTEREELQRNLASRAS